jgi:monofunctional biosynthetic peptidoglycan transglycosylase
LALARRLARALASACRFGYGALRTRIAYAACASRLRLALCAKLGSEERRALLPALPSPKGTKPGKHPAAASIAPRVSAAPAAGRHKPTAAVKRLRSWSLKALRLIAYAHIAFIGATSLLIICYRSVDPPVTVLALSRKYLDGWTIQRPVPSTMASLPKTLRFMLVAVEDSKFWTHNGFDLEAFKRAAEVNKAIGQPLYGGSTLTMQLARTLFLVPAKSYVRKYLELIIALELELFLPKERILELYFSWAEWGKGVFGVGAASAWHYKKSARNLSVDQWARLVAILSSPIRYGPYDLEKRSILRSRYEFLLKKYGG